MIGWERLRHAALASTSSNPSRIFGWWGSSDDMDVIHSHHNARRSDARASMKDGVAFFGYHGRGVQVRAAPKIEMCQVQMAL